MTAIFLKRAAKTPASDDAETQVLVAGMLREIEAGGEAVVRDYARRFDH